MTTRLYSTETAEVDGLTIHKYAPNDRPSARIVIVHGAMDVSSGFTAMAEELSDFEVLRYDRRGYGINIKEGMNPLTIEEHANDLLRILGHQETYVFAHSLGSIVALDAASRAPEVVKGLVLYEPPIPWADWWPAPVLPKQDLPTEQEIHVAVEGFLQRLLGHERWQSLSDDKLRRFQRWGPAWATELNDARHNGPTFDLSSISAPVLVAYGSATEERHRKGAHELAALLRNVSVSVIERGTHLAPHQLPRQLANLVRNFIRE